MEWWNFPSLWAQILPKFLQNFIELLLWFSLNSQHSSKFLQKKFLQFLEFPRHFPKLFRCVITEDTPPEPFSVVNIFPACKLRFRQAKFQKTHFVISSKFSKCLQIYLKMRFNFSSSLKIFPSVLYSDTPTESWRYVGISNPWFQILPKYPQSSLNFPKICLNVRKNELPLMKFPQLFPWFFRRLSLSHPTRTVYWFKIFPYCKLKFNENFLKVLLIFWKFLKIFVVSYQFSKFFKNFHKNVFSFLQFSQIFPKAWPLGHLSWTVEWRWRFHF